MELFARHHGNPLQLLRSVLASAVAAVTSFTWGLLMDYERWGS